MSNKKKSTEPKNFETALEELESVVEKLDAGNLSLEDALDEFEKGVRLSKSCQATLNNAENRIKILLDDEEQDFDFSDDAVDKKSDKADSE